MSRGRPREFDADVALDQALRVFWARGFRNTSMADLTDATGLAKPSLYAAFGDKEALFVKALERYAASYGAAAAAALESTSDAREAVRRYLDEIVDLVSGKDRRIGCLMANSVVECPTLDAEARRAVNDLRARNKSLLRKRLARAKRDGDIPDGENLDALAEFIDSQTLALAALGRGGAPRSRLKRIVRMAMRAWPAAAATPRD